METPENISYSYYPGLINQGRRDNDNDRPARPPDPTRLNVEVGFIPDRGLHKSSTILERFLMPRFQGFDGICTGIHWG